MHSKRMFQGALFNGCCGIYTKRKLKGCMRTDTTFATEFEERGHLRSVMQSWGIRILKVYGFFEKEGLLYVREM